MWKKLKSLFSKHKPDALVRYRSPAVKLTLMEFQKNEQLVTEAMKLSTYPIWRVMMAVMRNESPAEWKLPQTGTQPTDRVVLQSQTEGYMMAINNLESMSSPLVEEVQVEATFAPEEG
jgi:purine nucleoside permease